MGKTAHRYIVNAVGKGGEIYLTHCQNKDELEDWLAKHKDKLIMDELRVIDRKTHPILKLFGGQKKN